MFLYYFWDCSMFPCSIQLYNTNRFSFNNLVSILKLGKNRILRVWGKAPHSQNANSSSISG